MLFTMSLAAAASILIGSAPARAAIITEWTFETSQPTTSGPAAAEVGTGSASGSHAGAAVYSTPSGNGSTHAYSANTWASGDYWQFTTSTTGSVGIDFQFDQTSSNTGPRDFQLEYSTDGSLFTNFGSVYAVLANAAPNVAWTPATYNPVYTTLEDLSSVTALNNQPAIYIRLADTDATSANGGTVGTAGTDRVDNVIIGTGLSLPEPASLGILALGGMSLLGRRRRA
jgi:hypothetical protein